MQIDICTTTYRNTAKLKTFLSSVVSKTKYVDYKIFVLANDPNDEVKKVIEDSMYLDGILFNDRIEPVFNDDNSGSFSSNNNLIAAEGNGDYILFANDDTYPINEDWLHQMSRVLVSDQKVGVVGALLLYPGAKIIQHCGVFFSHRTNNLPYHMFFRKPLKEVAGFVYMPRYYQAVTGACMLVRRSDFEKIGGFSEDYWYSFEDTDLCINMKSKLKKSCVFTPMAQLIHAEGISGTQPRLTENINAFRKNCAGKYYNDLEFYQNDPRFMLYKTK